jgi:hypothetical protein
VGARARKGDWVQIHRILLGPGERAPQVPPDTQAVPLEMWVKGFLVEGGELGHPATVRTVAGREVQGTLVAVRPGPGHDFGEPVPELLTVGLEAREFLKSVGG